jgi:hypothetical protein
MLKNVFSSNLNKNIIFNYNLNKNIRFSSNLNKNIIFSSNLNKIFSSNLNKNIILFNLNNKYISKDDIHKYYNIKNIKKIIINKNNIKTVFNSSSTTLEYLVDPKDIIKQTKINLFTQENMLDKDLNLKITHNYVENVINTNNVACLENIIKQKTFFSFMNINMQKVELNTLKCILNLGYELDYFNLAEIIKHNRLDILDILDLCFEKKIIKKKNLIKNKKIFL